MQRSTLLVLSCALWCHSAGLSLAASPPAKVVEQFIEAHLQGQFAASRTLALERVNLKASPFSNWLFGPVGVGADASTADLFLSRKFTQAFRYGIQGTAATGDNQVTVTVVRSSPNLAHMYTWALAPKRGSSPYDLIEALDAYLTKINFPTEESRMQFVLVREVDSWYISMVYDEKFAQLQQQLQGQTQLSAAASAPGATDTRSPATGVPEATTTSGDVGRQLADAQFNATLQGFNRAYQGAGAAAANTPAPKKEEDEPGFFGKISRSLFGSGGNSTAVKNLTPSVNQSFTNIRDALTRFAVSNSGVPAGNTIYDWKSLREVVNKHAKIPLPATEEEAGFSFVDYKTEFNREGYVLVVDLHTPQDGVKRVEISNYGVDRIN